MVIQLFKILLLLIEAKKYQSFADGNNYRLVSGYYLSIVWDDITIVYENHDREIDADMPSVVSFNMSLPLTATNHAFIVKMLSQELWSKFAQFLQENTEYEHTAESLWEVTPEEEYTTDNSFLTEETDLQIKPEREDGKQWKKKKVA